MTSTILPTSSFLNTNDVQSRLHTRDILPYASLLLIRRVGNLLAGGNGVVDSLVLLTGDLGLFVSSVPYGLYRYQSGEGSVDWIENHVRLGRYSPTRSVIATELKAHA